MFIRAEPQCSYIASNRATLPLGPRLTCLCKQTGDDSLQIRALAIVDYSILKFRIVLALDRTSLTPFRQQGSWILCDWLPDAKQDDLIVVQRRNVDAEFENRYVTPFLNFDTSSDHPHGSSHSASWPAREESA